MSDPASGQRDLASKGFLATDRNQEMKATDLELMSLQKIEDVTAKQPTHEPVPLSGFTTFTVLAPAVAPEEIVMLAVSLPELTKVVECTVTPDPNLT